MRTRYIWIRGSTGGTISYHATLYGALKECFWLLMHWKRQGIRKEQTFLSRCDRGAGEDGWIVNVINRVIV